MDISGMMKGLKTKMELLQKESEEKKSKETKVGEAAGGQVKVTINCNYEMVDVYISKELMNEEDEEDSDNQEITSCLVKTAFNNAKKQVDEYNKDLDPGTDLMKNMGFPF